MTVDELDIIDLESDALLPEDRAEILEMCRLAYGEELEALFRLFPPATHLLGRRKGQLVSHVMWVTRWLQSGKMAPLRTAYIEMVATHPAHQGMGYASRLMQETVGRLVNFELAALSPAETTLYSRLGWTFWRGPLFIRRDQELLPTPDERVMVFLLPGTPDLDLDAPLSAEWREGEVW